MKHKILKKLLLLFLLLLAVGICFPVVFLIVGSLMGPDELNHYLGAVLGKTDGFASWALLPTYPTFKAYVQLLLDSPEFFVEFSEDDRRYFDRTGIDRCSGSLGICQTGYPGKEGSV